MEYQCQQSALHELNQLALADRHSILIEGPKGCGKTYLSTRYAEMLSISDIQFIEPAVNAIRSCIDECAKLSTPVLICVENLDCGVPGASHTLLKFLEEPLSNVYIVITCRNMYALPDTIMSRSVCICAAPPINSDIIEYAEFQNSSKYNELKSSALWACANSFTDVDVLLNLSSDQLAYFAELSTITKFVDSVSNLAWKLGHYADNSPTPIDIVLRYVSILSNSKYVQRCAIDCISDITLGRISAQSALAKFCFIVKYTEG